MKKVFSLTLILLSLMITPCYASILPGVQQSRTKLYVDTQTTVHSPQIRYRLTVRPGFTSVKADVIVENTDTVNPVDLTMAIPTIMENNYVVSQLSVSTDNLPLKVYESNGVASPENPDKVLYDKLYYWTLSLAPGERKSIDVNFSTNTKQLNDGTLNLLFPLKQLKLWNGDIDYIEVTADLDFFPAYAFNPNPDPMPDHYSDNGRLVWYFYNEDYPDMINLSFQSFSSIMNAYFAGPSSEDAVLTQILRDYDSANYDAARLGITNYQLTAPDSPYINELLYIQALCSIELGYWDDALILLEDLENKSLYDEAYQSTIQNRIIYEKYYILYHTNKEAAANYIAQIAETNKDMTSIFTQWVTAENALLNPPAVETIVEEVPATNLTPEEPSNLNNQQIDSFSITKLLKLDEPFNIFTFSIARQWVYLGVLILVLILILILIINSRKHKKKYGRRKKYRF